MDLIMTIRNVLSKLIEPTMLAFLISFVLPFTVFFYNQQEFTFNTHSFLLKPLFIFCSIIAITLPALMVSGRIRKLAASTCVVLSAYLLIANFITPVQVGVLDGIRDTDVFKFSVASVFEMAKYFVLFFALLVICKKKYHLIRDFAIFGCALSFIWLLYVSWSATNSQKVDGAPVLVDTAPIANVSKKKNIFIISFDALQGDAVEDVILSTPELMKALDGFVFFPDTSSAAPSTGRSLFLTLLGKIPGSLDGNLVEWKRDYRENVLPSVLHKKGYQVLVYGDGFNDCFYVDGVNCYKRGVFLDLDKDKRTVKREPQLWTYSAMRVLPTYLHSVFTNLIVSNIPELIKDETDAHPGQDARDHQFGYDFFEFQIFKKKLKTNTDKPVLHLHHYLFTHQPINLDESCNYHLSSTIPQNIPSAKKEIACTLNSFVGLIKKLKLLGAYDNSLIIFMSDHGYGPKINQDPELSDDMQVLGNSFINKNGLGSASRYHPALMFKDFKSRGELTVSRYPASLLDIAPTLCNRVYDESACETRNFQGKDLSTLTDMDRERSFLMYIGGDENIIGGGYFTNNSLFKKINFKGEVTKSVPKAMMPQLAKIICGEQLSFSDKNGPEKFLSYGLPTRGPHGSWTSGDRTIIQFLYQPKDCKEVTLNLEARGFVNPKNKNVTSSLYLNREFIGELKFNYKEQQKIGTKKYSFKIPNEIIKLDGFNSIELKIRGAKTPYSLGMGKDVRPLGLFLMNLTFKEQTPESQPNRGERPE